MEKIIEVKELYAGYDKNVIIENINLDVFKNEFVGIIGPNGGGKTTFLKTLLGLHPVKSGSIKIFGNSPETARKFFGYVPQENKFDWKFPMKVIDIVLSGRLKFKNGFKYYYSKDDLKKSNEMLERFDMLKYKDTHISELSGGQKKRVFICRALVTESDILLLDEPTSELDAHIENTIYDKLKKLNEHKTIILVTHDIGIISGYVTKVCCLNRKLFYHESGKITGDMIREAYHCPVDLIAHGIPHRVFEEH
ncbi:ABC transporter ATP-binding protein [Candidatus Dependentiae bacterium]|nr:ABC transporter ATP-binding protein [Candidatus Dependentiae bacterium]